MYVSGKFPVEWASLSNRGNFSTSRLYWNFITVLSIFIKSKVTHGDTVWISKEPLNVWYLGSYQFTEQIYIIMIEDTNLWPTVVYNHHWSGLCEIPCLSLELREIYAWQKVKNCLSVQKRFIICCLKTKIRTNHVYLLTSMDNPLMKSKISGFFCNLYKENELSWKNIFLW